MPSSCCSVPVYSFCVGADVMRHHLVISWIWLFLILPTFFLASGSLSNISPERKQRVQSFHNLLQLELVSSSRRQQTKAKRKDDSSSGSNKEEPEEAEDKHDESQAKVKKKGSSIKKKKNGKKERERKQDNIDNQEDKSEREINGDEDKPIDRLAHKKIRKKSDKQDHEIPTPRVKKREKVRDDQEEEEKEEEEKEEEEKQEEEEKEEEGGMTTKTKAPRGVRVTKASELSVFVMVERMKELVHLKQALTSLLNTQAQLQDLSQKDKPGPLFAIVEIVVVPTGPFGATAQANLQYLYDTISNPLISILPMPWSHVGNATSHGVAARANLAVKSAKAKYVLMLSQFVEVSAPAILALGRALASSEKAGMVSGQLVALDGTIHYAGRQLVLGPNPDKERERELCPEIENQQQGYSQYDSRVQEDRAVVAPHRAYVLFKKDVFLHVKGYKDPLLIPAGFSSTQANRPQFQYSQGERSDKDKDKLLDEHVPGPTLETDLAFRLRQKMKLGSWYIPMAKAVWNAPHEMEQADKEEDILAFCDKWREPYQEWLPQRDLDLSQVSIDWNMECGTGQVLGFTTEALNLLPALEKLVRVRVTVSDREHCISELTKVQFPSSLRRTIARLFRVMKKGSTVQIMHRDPGRYSQHRDTGAALRVGRSMYESDRIPAHWKDSILGLIDELWVPSVFNVQTFSKAGINASLIQPLDESIDVYHFDPAAHTSLPLPMYTDREGNYLDQLHQRAHPRASDHTSISSTSSDKKNQLQFNETKKGGKGKKKNKKKKRDDVNKPGSAAWHSRKDQPSGEWTKLQYENGHRFLMVGKWEIRKGWDYLLRAYFEAFSSKDPVSLHILSRLDKENREDLDYLLGQYVNDDLELLTKLPPVFFIDELLSYGQLPALYKAVDTFVLPTHGEGWGLPIMEAMSMELPVIVTNWSGLTAFATSETAYLIPANSLELAEEVEDGTHQWAVPDLDALRNLLRKCVLEPEEAKKKGKRARQHIVNEWNSEVVAKRYTTRLKYIIAHKEELTRESNKREHEVYPNGVYAYDGGGGQTYQDWGNNDVWNQHQNNNWNQNNPYNGRSNRWNQKAKSAGRKAIKINP
eukprot:g8517.t1